MAPRPAINVIKNRCIFILVIFGIVNLMCTSSVKHRLESQNPGNFVPHPTKRCVYLALSVFIDNQ